MTETSVRFPDMNLFRPGTTCVKLELPDAATKKAADQGYTIGMFISPPQNRGGTDQVIWGRLNGNPTLNATSTVNTAVMVIGPSTTHFSSGSIVFSAQPAPNSTVTICQLNFTFVPSGATGDFQVNIGATLNDTLTNLSTKLNSLSSGIVVTGRIANATYSVSGGNTLAIVYDTVGPAGDTHTIAASPSSNGVASAPTLLGGDHLLRFQGRTGVAGGAVNSTSIGQPNPIYCYPGRRYFIAMIVTQFNAWLVACECGQTPQIQLLNGNGGYAQVHTGAFQNCIRLLGGPDTADLSRNYTGALSDVFLLQGDFPLDVPVTGSPLASLIQGIADRSVPINDALHNQFVPKRVLPGNSFSPRFYYPLRTPTDLTEVLGGFGSTTINGNAAFLTTAANAGLYVSTGLNTNKLVPRLTIDHSSQCEFALPITSTRNAAQAMLTATTTIGSERGTYTNLPTLNNIQARLIDAKTGVEVHARRIVDPAPTGGVWAENQNAFTGIPMRVGWMAVQYRAYDGTDQPLTDWVTQHGLRAAGFNIYSCGQSGWQVPFEGASSGVPQLPAAVNGQVCGVKGHLPQTGTSLGTTQPFGRNFECGPIMVGQGQQPNEVRWGPRTVMAELDQLFPGVPVGFTSVGESGMGFDFWDPGNSFPALFPRFQALKDAIGVRQPYMWIWMAHNAGPGDNYNEKLGRVTTYVEGLFGPAIRHMFTMTGRGAIPGNTPLPNTFLAASHIQNQEMVSLFETQQFCSDINNPRFWFMGMDTSTASIAETPPRTGSDAHTGSSAKGGGRWGLTVFYYILSGCRAIPDIPLRVRVRADGADAVISFEPGVPL